VARSGRRRKSITDEALRVGRRNTVTEAKLISFFLTCHLSVPSELFEQDSPVGFPTCSPRRISRKSASSNTAASAPDPRSKGGDLFLSSNHSNESCAVTHTLGHAPSAGFSRRHALHKQPTSARPLNRAPRPTKSWGGPQSTGRSLLRR